MALTKDKPISKEVESFGQYPVYASAEIFEGSMVGKYTSYARALVAGDEFLGHCIQYVKDTAGVSATEVVRVLRGRYRLQVAVPSVAYTSVGRLVWATDDATLTLTNSDGTPVGRVDRYVSSGLAVVEFDTSIGKELVVGSWDDAGTAGYGVTLSSARQFAAGIYADDGGASVTAGWYSAAFAQYLDSIAATGNVSAFGITGELHCKAVNQGGGNRAGIYGYAEIQAGITHEVWNTQSFSAGLFGIDLNSTAVLTGGTMSCVCLGAGTLAGTHTSGKVAPIHIQNPGSGSFDYLFVIGDRHSGGPGDATGCVETISGNASNQTKGIKISIGATAYWIPCQSATS
jgi:hypothetical protein